MAWTSSNRKQRLPSNWDDLRLKVLIRDRRRCQIRGRRCLGKATQVDHIVPGDDHRLSNLRAVCERCHATKSAREGARARLARANKALRARPPEAHPGIKKPPRR